MKIRACSKKKTRFHIATRKKKTRVRGFSKFLNRWNAGVQENLFDEFKNTDRVV